MRHHIHFFAVTHFYRHRLLLAYMLVCLPCVILYVLCVCAKFSLCATRVWETVVKRTFRDLFSRYFPRSSFLFSFSFIIMISSLCRAILNPCQLDLNRERSARVWRTSCIANSYYMNVIMLVWAIFVCPLAGRVCVCEGGKWCELPSLHMQTPTGNNWDWMTVIPIQVHSDWVMKQSHLRIPYLHTWMLFFSCKKKKRGSGMPIISVSTDLKTAKKNKTKHLRRQNRILPDMHS